MKKYIAEFTGTAIPVLFGCGSAVAANTLPGNSVQTVPMAFSTLLTAFSFGLLIHILGIPFTGTSVNPARSFDPALLAGGQAHTQIWLFVAALLTVTALVHKYVLAEDAK